MKKINPLARNADPYEVVMHAVSLFTNEGAESAVEFIKVAYPIRKGHLEELKNKLEDLLDDTKEYTGRDSRAIALKRCRTKIDNEVKHLGQLVEIYNRISPEPIENIEAIKK